ncbi:MAG: glycosyltransferase family 39 protein [Xanthobacteraceae bacterium]|jgi:4-amino-4-deoxy-L-arabinose transferase-like glycosyltransferase
MRYISLLVEALRARPAAMFWTATLSQALLWTLVPVIFYAAPPGDLPLVLAIGHHWPLGSALGPPLANWLGELAFDLAGGRLTGVYLLSQGCVIVTFWAVFALGRSIVGTRHAVMAVLLMVGILSFSVPTPDFGPAVLAMPLAALALLHTWRAVAEGRRRYWLALGIDLGLLLLTIYAGLILVALIIGFIAATPRGRAAVGNVDAWAAGMIAVLIVFPHLIWLETSGAAAWPDLGAIGHLLGFDGHLFGWVKLIALVLAAHGLMLVLVMVAGGVGKPAKDTAPAFERHAPDPLAPTFVHTFALAPAVTATLVAALLGQKIPAGGIGWIVVLSGLAAVLAAGNVIRLHRERFVGVVWLGLLLAPAVAVMAGATVLPLAGMDLEIAQPVSAMAQFFTESFRRRTGKPLQVVVGDVRLAGAVALASPDRPSLFAAASPGLTPWVSDADIRRKGAVLLWPATDSAGHPPDAIKSRFPDIVPELPRSFQRSVQGRLPLLRIGWAVIRPAQ